MHWLEREASGKDLFICIAGYLIIRLAYCFALLGTIFFLNRGPAQVSAEDTAMATLIVPFLFMLLGVAGLEELFFRLPLMIAVECGCSTKKILAAAIVLSVAFGFRHGGFLSIFIQGVSGFILCVLFLKSGGYQGKYGKALTVVWLTHFLFNGTLAAIQAAGGYQFF